MPEYLKKGPLIKRNYKIMEPLNKCNCGKGRPPKK